MSIAPYDAAEIRLVLQGYECGVSSDSIESARAHLPALLQDYRNQPEYKELSEIIYKTNGKPVTPKQAIKLMKRIDSIPTSDRAKL